MPSHCVPLYVPLYVTVVTVIGVFAKDKRYRRYVGGAGTGGTRPGASVLPHIQSMK